MCLPQKQAETQSTFWTAIFEDKSTLWHMRPNKYIRKTKSSSHNQYLFGFLFSRNAKKARTDQSILKTLLLCPSCFVWKGTSHKLLKVAAAKTFFQSVHIIDTTWYWLIYTNLSLTRGLVNPPCCCVLWNKCAFYIRYLNNNITMLLMPKVHNKISTS